MEKQELTGYNGSMGRESRGSMLIKMSALFSFLVISFGANADVSSGFAKVYSRAKNWNDVLVNLSVNETTRGILVKRLAGQPLPKITVVDSVTVKFDSVEVRIVNKDKREIAVNGRRIVFRENAPLSERLNLIDNAIAFKPTVWYRPLVENILGEAHAELNKRLYGIKDVAMGDPTQIPDRLPSQFAMPLYIVIAPAAYADWGLTYVETYLGSSKCAKQIPTLQKLLEHKKMGIADISCGEDHRGNDRSIAIWTTGPDGHTMKREFEYNRRLGLMQETIRTDREGVPLTRKSSKGKGDEEEESRVVMYEFGFWKLGGAPRQLKSVRTLQPNERGNMVRVDYHPGSEEFDYYKNDIEAVREVMFHLGDNNTCERCSDELENEVVTVRPPSYMPKSAPEVAPGAGLSGGEPRPPSVLSGGEDEVSAKK